MIFANTGLVGPGALESCDAGRGKPGNLRFWAREPPKSEMLRRCTPVGRGHGLLNFSDLQIPREALGKGGPSSPPSAPYATRMFGEVRGLRTLEVISPGASRLRDFQRRGEDAPFEVADRTSKKRADTSIKDCDKF